MAKGKQVFFEKKNQKIFTPCPWLPTGVTEGLVFLRILMRRRPYLLFTHSQLREPNNLRKSQKCSRNVVPERC